MRGDSLHEQLEQAVGGGQDQRRPFVEDLLVGFECLQGRREFGIAAVRFVQDADGVGVAVTADSFRFRIGFGEQFARLTVRQ